MATISDRHNQQIKDAIPLSKVERNTNIWNREPYSNSSQAFRFGRIPEHLLPQAADTSDDEDEEVDGSKAIDLGYEGNSVVRSRETQCEEKEAAHFRAMPPEQAFESLLAAYQHACAENAGLRAQSTILKHMSTDIASTSAVSLAAVAVPDPGATETASGAEAHDSSKVEEKAPHPAFHFKKIIGGLGLRRGGEISGSPRAGWAAKIGNDSTRLREASPGGHEDGDEITHTKLAGRIDNMAGDGPIKCKSECARSGAAMRGFETGMADVDIA